MKRIYILLASFVLCFAAAVSAESITVLDTAGEVRAEQAIDPQGGSVQFTLTDDKGNVADGIEVKLTNKLTGETMVQTSTNGVVVFEGIAAGSWIVSTSAANIVFTAATIAPLSVAGSLGALGLSSTAVAAGGVTAVTATTVAIAANNDRKSDDMSPSS